MGLLAPHAFWVAYLCARTHDMQFLGPVYTILFEHVSNSRMHNQNMQLSPSDVWFS